MLALWGGLRPAWAQQEGLLLGLRLDVPVPQPLPYYAGSPDSLARSLYRTLLLVRQGRSITLAASAEGLIVPRGRRFWTLDAKRSVYNNWVEDFLFAAPVGQPIRLRGIDPYNGEACTGHRTQALLYAGADFVAFNQRSAGYCEGGAHPWAFNTLAFVPIDSLAHLGLAIGEVLGPSGAAAFDEAAARFLGQLAPEARSAYLPTPDPANWALRRQQGRWVVQGRLEAAAGGAGRFADFTLPLSPPARLVGDNRLTPPWRQVKAALPEALDALSAPSRDFVVVLHPGRLTAHLVDEGRLGPAVLSLATGPNPSVIMARWAVGPSLERWRDFLQRPGS